MQVQMLVDMLLDQNMLLLTFDVVEKIVQTIKTKNEFFCYQINENQLCVYLHLYVENKSVHLQIDENPHEKQDVLWISVLFHYHLYDLKQYLIQKDIVHVVKDSLQISDDQVIFLKNI